MGLDFREKLRTILPYVIQNILCNTSIHKICQIQIKLQIVRLYNRNQLQVGLKEIFKITNDNLYDNACSPLEVHYKYAQFEISLTFKREIIFK